MTQPATSPVLQALQAKLREAAELRIALALEEMGTLKKQIRLFLQANPLFADLFPHVWFREDHTSTGDLETALLAALGRVNGLPSEREIVAHLTICSEYVRRARLTLDAQASLEDKKALKKRARTYLAKPGVAGHAALPTKLVRKDHRPSAQYVDALWKTRGVLVRQHEAGASSRPRADIEGDIAEAEVLVNGLNPFSGKSHLKAEVTHLFGTKLADARLGSLSVLAAVRKKRWFREGHAPTRNLLGALEEVEAALRAVQTEEQRTQLKAEIAESLALLTKRRAMKVRVGELEARAVELENGLRTSLGHASQFVEKLAAARAEAQRALLLAKGTLAAATHALFEVQTKLEAARSAAAAAGEAYEVKRAASEATESDAYLAYRRLEGAEEALASEEARLLAQIDELSIEITGMLTALDEIAQVELHSRASSESLKNAMAAAKAAWTEYKSVRALVLYFTLKDDIGGTLLKLGRFLKGNQDAADAMGQMTLVLAFEAGVRAGVELGIVDLYAKVQLSLVVSGTLGIVDSRQMMFSHRVALYLTATAKARVSGGGELADAFHIPVAVPETLVEASVKAKCRLYDVESCHVYENEQHWADHWAHEMARKLAFLQIYRATEPAHNAADADGKDWVLDTLERLRGGKLATSGSPTDDLLARAESSLKRMLAKKVWVVTVEPTDRLELSGVVKLGDSRSYARANRAPTRATFEAKMADYASSSTATALGTLEEDVSRSSSDSSIDSTVIFHKLRLGPGSERLYLELMDKKASTAAGTDWSLSSARAEGFTLSKHSERFKIACLLRDTLPGRDTRTVTLPKLLGDAMKSPDDRKHLGELLGCRLDALQSKGELSLAERAINEAPTASADLARLRDRAASGAGRLAGLEARAPGGVNTVLAPVTGVVSGLATSAESVLGAASGASKILDASPFKATVSTSSYMRWTEQRIPKTTPGGLTWDTGRWTPQVYRGTDIKTFRFSARQELHVAPLVAAFFGASLDFRREFAEFEVLGLDTLSYLKSIDAPSWEAYSALHEAEIEEICRNVGRSNSGAFFEVALDAIEGSGTERAPARAFGRACWAYAGRQGENPFDSDGAAILTAASNPSRTRAASNPLTTREIRDRVEVLIQMAAIDQEASRIASDIERVLEISHLYRAKSAPLPSKEKALLESRRTAALAARTDRGRLLERWSREFEQRLRVVPDSATHATLHPVARELAPWFEATIQALRTEGDLWLWGGSAWTPVTPFTISEARKAGHALSVLFDGVAPRVLRPSLETTLPESSQWVTKSKEGIPLYVLRSGATHTLDKAVEAFWKALRTWRETHSWEDASRLKTRRMAPVACTKLADDTLLALDERVRIGDTLLLAVETWKKGRGPASNRTHHVRSYLERPLHQDRVLLTSMRLFLKGRRALASAIDDHSWLTPPPPPRLVTAVDVRTALARYLDATKDQFRSHAFMHGVKKLTLPGEKVAVEGGGAS